LLTIEAMRERKWGRFPGLRTVLQDKPPSGLRHGPTSVSDTVVEEYGRLAEITDLLEEYKEELLQAIRTEPHLGPGIDSDLSDLQFSLDGLRHRLTRGIEAIESLRAQVHTLQRMS
jgi:hypothetical protein